MSRNAGRIRFAVELGIALIRNNQKLGHLYLLLSAITPLSLWLGASERWYQGLFVASNIYLVSLLSYDDDLTTQDFYLVHTIGGIYRSLAKVMIIVLLITGQTIYLVLISPWPVYVSNTALFFTLYLSFSHTAYVLNGILPLGLALTSLFLSVIAIFILGVVIVPTCVSFIVWTVNCALLLSYLYYQLKRYESQIY